MWCILQRQLLELLCWASVAVIDWCVIETATVIRPKPCGHLASVTSRIWAWHSCWAAKGIPGCALHHGRHHRRAKRSNIAAKWSRRSITIASCAIVRMLSSCC